VSLRRVVVRAPAKVNLTLAVLGRRADGFHELDTVLLALGLADRLEARRVDRPGLRLSVHGPAAAGVPGDGSNLVLRAAEQILAEHGLATGLEFELEKHIPAGGGLGGGSSDAAAATLATALLLGLEPDSPALGAGLARLGSDCTFFLAARASGLARCTGRGERVEPWPGTVLAWPLVLVAPTFGCATERVYKAHRGARRVWPALEAGELASLSHAALEARLGNDLLAAALASHPELARFQELLEEAAAGRFQLSGSGSSWFALAADEAEAGALRARVMAVAEARHHALRGPWITRASGAGVVREA
jgi:4-diphosphocytidyl-2-C-methyl-D-erythritol kinase